MVEKSISATVIIATYNAILNKALETLKSVLIQKEIDLQVIVADDGSMDNLFDEYRKCFEEHSFINYSLLASDHNQGTAKNLCRCKNYCKGRYIKLISPGDYLYGVNALRDWCDYMDANGLEMSVADAFYYMREDDEYRIVKEHAFPQAPQILNCNNERRKKYYQLIFNDYWLGAATLIRTDAFKKYISIVSDIVIYGEDNMYRIAAADGISRGYYNKPAVMYETNTGISSLGEKGKRWHHVLMREWVDTNNYIIGNIDLENGLKRKLRMFTDWKEQNEDIRESKLTGKNLFSIAMRLIPLYVAIPDMIIWNIKRVVLPRQTATNVNMSLLKELFN